MLVIAHRGCHREAPENSLLAFERAIDARADGVELDVRVTADGRVAVMHDPHTGRVADRAVFVAMSSMARLQEVELGFDQRPPSLHDAIDLVVGAGLELHVEIKGDVPDRRALVDAVASVIDGRSARVRDAIVISSFHPTILFAIEKLLPSVRAALLYHGRPRRAVWVADWLEVDGIHPHHPLCTPSLLRRQGRRGRFVNAWTVDCPRDITRLQAMGVSGVITDSVPGALLALGR